MANLGKGITAMGEGIVAGLKIGQEGKRLKLLEEEIDLQKEQAKRAYELKLREQQLEEMQLRVLNKQEEVAVIEANNEKMSGAIDFVESMFAGREDITPAMKESAEKLFNENYGFDISPYFQPNKNDEGVVESFSMNTGDSIRKAYENETSRINALASKTSAAASMLQAEVDRAKLSRGDLPKTAAEGVLSALYNDPKFQQAPAEQKIQRISDAMWELPTESTQVAMPGEKGTRTKTEEKLMGITRQITDIEDIGENFSETYLTYPGKAKQFVLDKVLKGGKTVEDLASLSQEDREFVRGYTRFQNAVMKTHNMYVNAISGAQFSIKELERYEKSLMNMKQNYESFTASYNQYTNFLKKSQRLYTMALNEGYTGEGIGSRVDELMMLPVDKSLDPESIQSRGDQLFRHIRKSNPDAPMEEIKQMVKRQLRTEGYTK